MAAEHQKYEVMKISEYVIKYYKDKNKPINNTRLQGVLYFIQAYFLMRTDNVCFIDDLEAREVGPVVPNVYAKYSSYGPDPLPISKDYSEPIFTKADKEIIDEVLDYTFSWSNSAMTNLIHDQRPYRHAKNTHSRLIPPAKLKSYFG